MSFRKFEYTPKATLDKTAVFSFPGVMIEKITLLPEKVSRQSHDGDPRLHEQFLCDSFYETIFICSCRLTKFTNVN